MNYIRTLIIRFNNPLTRDKLTKFRGAVVASMDNSNVLFHNHKEDGLRYSYPLIQYKVLDNKAAIVCVGEGTEVISDFFTNSELSINIGDDPVAVELEDIKAERTLVQLWREPIVYRLLSWVPFNAENYKKYLQLSGIVEQTQFLENILVGNILSFLKGVGIRIEERIECHLKYVSEPRSITFKNVKMICFNVDFSSNISLPSYIGLGKHPSVGFGLILRKRNPRNNNERGKSVEDNNQSINDNNKDTNNDEKRTDIS